MKIIEMNDLDIYDNLMFKKIIHRFVDHNHLHQFYDLVSRCRKFIDDGHLLYVGYLLTFQNDFYEMMKIYIDHDGIDFEKAKECYQYNNNRIFREYIDIIYKIYSDENVDLCKEDIDCSFLPITAAMEIRQLYIDTKIDLYKENINCNFIPFAAAVEIRQLYLDEKKAGGLDE